MESVVNGVLAIERDVEAKEFMNRKDIKWLVVLGDHKIGNEAFLFTDVRSLGLYICRTMTR